MSLLPSDLPATEWGFHDYDREVVARAWARAEVIPGNDDELWRKDECGAWIHRLDYGRRSSSFGWEVFDPSLGRGDGGISAIRPLSHFCRRMTELPRFSGAADPTIPGDRSETAAFFPVQG